MRSVVIAGLLFVVLATGIHMLFLREMGKDQGREVLVAFGVPMGDTIQMHVGIKVGVLFRDPPRVDAKGRRLLKEWVAEHFFLREKSGERVNMKRLGTSAMIESARAAAAVEFSLEATLKQGAEYTLDFTPDTTEPKRYRYEFTAPSEEEEAWHKKFLPAEEEDGA